MNIWQKNLILTEKTLAQFADSFSSFLLRQRRPQSINIIMQGDLGAGKSTLVSSLIKSLGSKDIVRSPTYNLVNSYNIKNIIVNHWDWYRIVDKEEILFLGFYEQLVKNNINFIEWGDKFMDLAPFDLIIKINFVPQKNHQRQVNVIEFNQLLIK